MSLKPQVLGLYRRLLRTSRTWTAINPSDTEEEKKYILSETRRLFRENISVSYIPRYIQLHVQFV